MLEVLVVMGIFVLVGGFALFVSMETYRGSSFRSDRDLFIALLQRARAQSVSNTCAGTCTDGRPHGVKILSNSTMTLFQGTTYAARDVSADAVFALNVATTSGVDEFVFTQLSGTTTMATTTLADHAGHVSTTTVNSEAQISWTH